MVHFRLEVCCLNEVEQISSWTQDLKLHLKNIFIFTTGQMKCNVSAAAHRDESTEKCPTPAIL